MSSFAPARRAGVSCIIGIAGETGSGKSLSALRVSRGLAADPGDDLSDPATLARVDARIAAIDTEGGRLSHYAVAEGETPTPFSPRAGARFGFACADLRPPFEPEAYQALILEAEAAGFRVIMVDSFSHEWDGEGGCTDIHEADLDAMVARARAKAADKSGELPHWWNEDTQRDKLSITAWKGPKLRHKRMVGRLLQCRAHLVLCMRAEDKLRIETRKEEGRSGREYTKTEITPAKDLPARDRWQPICEKRFPYQLITSLVLTPDAPGVPIPLKLQEQHRAFLKSEQPLDESFGVAMAAWARGAQPIASRPVKPAPSSSYGAGSAGGGDESPPSAPPPASDDFPGDAIPYGGAHYFPSRAVRVDPAGGASEWVTTLAALIKAAPPEAKAQWLREQDPQVFSALPDKVRRRLEALAPPM